MEIELEDSDLDVNEFRYTTDAANSALNPKLDPSGWDVTDFRITEEDHRYVTNFGDPELSSGSGSTYSRLIVKIELSHDAPALLLKLLGPMYVAFLVAVATFLLLLQNAPSAIGRKLSREGMIGSAAIYVALNIAILILTVRTG